MPNIPSIKIGNTTYKVKDEVAREHLVEVSNTQPSSPDNRLWIKNAENEYQIPTYEEFEKVNSAFPYSFYTDEIPYGKTITYSYNNLPVYADHSYIANTGEINPEGATAAKVVYLPSAGIKSISITATADQTAYRGAYVVILHRDKSFYQRLFIGSGLSTAEKTYRVELDRLGFDYETFVCFNWLGTDASQPVICNDSVTIEYFTREEWYLSVSTAGEESKEYDIFTPALPLFQVGNYMKTDGTLATLASSTVRMMTPDYIDSIYITYEAGHSTYPSAATPFAVLKDKNGAVVSFLNPSTSGTFTMLIDHDKADGGTLYINIFDTNDFYHAWKSYTGSDIFCAYHMTAKKRAYGAEKSPFSFLNYIRRPFDFSGKVVEFIGDSITEGVINTSPEIIYTQNTWAKLFCESVGVLSYVNHAKAGACYYDASNPNKKSMLEQLQDISTTPDFIFIAGGTNDWLLGTTLANFRSAVSDVVTYVKTNFANAKVIFITPINEAGWNGSPKARNVAPMQTFRDIISEEVIEGDNGNFSIIQGNSFNFPDATADADYIATIFGDNLHPTELGYRTVYLTNVLQCLC